MRLAGIIIFGACLAGLPLVAQAPAPVPFSGTFKIEQTNPVISTSTISGKEGYKITSTPEGHTISSHLWVAEGETPVLSEIEESFGPDWAFKRYTFDGLVGGIKQKFEAWVDGGKVQMRVTSERMNPQRAVELAPNTIVLDNFVPTNFQVLLNRFVAKQTSESAPGPQQVYLLVPQRLMALKGTFSRSGSDSGVLNGKPIQVQKFVLQAPGVKAEVWANEQNQVMGVYFAQPDIEYLDEHFDLPQLKLATKQKLPSERPVSFMSHGRQLLGTLTRPPEAQGKRGPFATVILVAGFGPVDRDESVGRSKPLRDIAMGLANKGIATLRYDKPTYSFRGRLEPTGLTVDEETIDAAAAAVTFARTLPEVDSENLFLLGHSEGGELAPFIAEKAGELRGLVLLAAPGRRPEEFLPDQLAAGLRLRGMAPEKIDERVSTLRKQLAAFRQSTHDSTTVLNMPADFWRSLMDHDSLAALRQVRVPVLVLQGDRDAQVNRKDFDLVSEAVPAEKLDREYFTGLDHIFASAAEGGNGSEILIGSHVAAQVIDRITGWLEKHKTGSAVASR